MDGGQNADLEFSAFRKSRESPDNVFLDWFGDNRDMAIAQGYRDSADIISSHIDNLPGEKPDRFFFAIAFLYRHALELLLKRTLVSATILVEGQQVAPACHGHNLDSLWKATRPLLLRVWPEDPRYLDPVDRIVEDLHRADPRGDAFRYHRDKNGKVHLDVLPRQITLSEFCREFGEAFELLDCAREGMEDKYQDVLRSRGEQELNGEEPE